MVQRPTHESDQGAVRALLKYTLAALCVSAVQAAHRAMQRGCSPEMCLRVYNK